MGGTDDEASAEGITEEQLESLAEDEGQPEKPETADSAEDEAPAGVADDKAPAPATGPTREQVTDWVRGAMRDAQPSADAGRQAREQPPPEPEDDMEMPVTRGELASLQQQIAANQQAAQFRAELQVAESQLAGEHDSEDKEDFYYATVRSLQGNPNQTVASAYKAAVDRHEAKINRAIKGRIDKAAERKLARGEPMGPGSGAAVAGAELPKFDPENNEDVDKMAQWVLDQMPSTPGVT